MMYTSQAGELYVGQARALGAVGVLPKQIKPVQVSATLMSLNLLQPEADAPTLVAGEAETDVAQTLADVEDMMEPAGLGRAASLVREHARAPRRYAARGYRSQRRATAEGKRPHGRTRRASTRRRDCSPARRGLSGVLNATTMLVAGLFLFAVTFFWMYVETQNDWRAVYEQNVGLLEALQAERDDTGAPESNCGSCRGARRRFVMDWIASCRTSNGL